WIGFRGALQVNEFTHQTANHTYYREMMLTDIGVLAGEIGARFAGSPGEERAARYIVERLAQDGLAVEATPFSIVGWSLQGARLDVLVPDHSPWHIESYPYVYSASTPHDGHYGRLTYAGKQDVMLANKFRPFERSKFRFRKYGIVDH